MQNSVVLNKTDLTPLIHKSGTLNCDKIWYHKLSDENLIAQKLHTKLIQ